MLLHIPTSDGPVVVSTQCIIRIEALSNYSKLHFTNRKPLVVSKVLHWFELRLPQDAFYRVHKSHLVNSIFILKARLHRTSSTVLLLNGETVCVSRRKKIQFYNGNQV